jgi:hypothetical protein
MTNKVSGNNTYQECLHTDFNDKQYFINLVVNETSDDHGQSGIINFKPKMGHMDETLIGREINSKTIITDIKLFLQTN